MLETQDAERLVSEVSFRGSSQWMRRLVAEEIGTPQWNWRMKEDRETAPRTVERMHGKF